MVLPILRSMWTCAAACGFVVSACGEVSSDVAPPDGGDDASAPPSARPHRDAAVDQRDDATTAGSGDATTEVPSVEIDGGPAILKCDPDPCPSGKYCHIRLYGGVGIVSECTPLADAGPCANEPTCASCFPECKSTPKECSCTEINGELVVTHY